MSGLAQQLLAFDHAHPGDPDALVEVPGEVWGRWVELARAGKRYDLGLVACSAKKWPGPERARNFYLGDLFKKSLAQAEALCRDVRILSAEHHVVHPDDVLEPYDLPLKARSARDRREWGGTVAGVLRHLRPSSVLCLAPESYWRHIVDARTPDGLFRLPKFDCPLRGLGIGQQKAALKRRAA